MEQTGYFINKELPAEIDSKLTPLMREGDRLIFVIVGDLTRKAGYGTTAFAVTETRFITVDPGLEGGVSEGLISDVESAAVKRMYGNAELRIKTKNGTSVTALRFT